MNIEWALSGPGTYSCTTKTTELAICQDDTAGTSIEAATLEALQRALVVVLEQSSQAISEYVNEVSAVAKGSC